MAVASGETVAQDPSKDGLMTNKADSDSLDELLSNSGERSQSPEEMARELEMARDLEMARESDDLACRLAYECGWRLCEDSLRTLGAQRTRAFTLLSVMLASAGIALSAFVGGEVREDLDLLGIIGLVVFALGALLITACAAVVAWPIETEAALRPSAIIKNYVTPEEEGRKTTWVYENLARDLEKAYDKMKNKLKARSRLYKCAVGLSPVVLIGAGMVVLDVVR